MEKLSENKKSIVVIMMVISFSAGWYIGDSNQPIGNQELRYGDTGFPKNCRALIAENMKGYVFGNYTAEEALGSIDRNCGASGYVWNEI